VTKVLVDSKQGSNLLYLPPSKILQQVSNPASTAAPATSSADATSGANGAGAIGLPADPRSRDNQRSRDRDAR